MNVVGHETEGMETYMKFVSIPRKAFVVHLVVLRGDESFLLVVATHDNVVQNARSKKPRTASHGSNITDSLRLSIYTGLTPVSAHQPQDMGVHLGKGARGKGAPYRFRRNGPVMDLLG